MTIVFEHTTDGDEGADAAERAVAEPTDLKFVGRATAAAIEAAEFDAQDVADKRVSYRMLVDAAVNPGVAAKIRRWHSLQWSFESGDDLSRRSEQIRGLQDEERAWVASSYGEAADGASTDRDDGTADAGDDPETEWVETARDDPTDETDDPDEASADSGPGDQFAAEADWVAGAKRERKGEATSADGSGDPVAAEAAWRERSKPTPLTELDGIGEQYERELSEAGVTSVRSLATADPALLADVTGISEAAVRKWYESANERAD